MAEKRGLGKGFGDLFSDTENAYGQTVKKDFYDFSAEKDGVNVRELEMERVFPNPDQPRKSFDNASLQELANSIAKHGVIMPIVVNTAENGRYRIIAGERRYRASLLAGMRTIPAVVRSYDERKVREIALIENLQREDLNPIEAARAMQTLLEEYRLTQEELADRLGKSRPAVTNALRLLTLDPAVIAKVTDGKLSAGHARVLIPLAPEKQIEFANLSEANGWSVRDMERNVKQFTTPNRIPTEKKGKKQQTATVELREFVDKMRSVFGTKVQLVGTNEKGRITIDYFTKDDLFRIYDLIDKLD